MAQRTAKKRTARFRETSVVLVAALFAALLGASLGNLRGTARATTPGLPKPQHSGEKVITIYERDDDIVRVGDVKFAGTKIKRGMKFDTDYLTAKARTQFSDWLEGVEFSIANNSTKRVTCILLEFYFPGTGGTRPDLAYRDFTVGIPPEGYFRTGKEEDLTLQPGDSGIGSLSREHLERIKKLFDMRSLKVNDVNRLQIRILGVFFDDGLMYSSGVYYKPNPASKRYERIDQK
jgi:hypothetical protein